jgi:hypothetical protein
MTEKFIMDLDYMSKPWAEAIKSYREKTASEGIKVHTLTDTKIDIHEWVEAETTYRRGYQQGYAQAMDDIRKSVKPTLWNDWATWFDKNMWNWRALSDAYFPPIYK